MSPRAAAAAAGLAVLLATVGLIGTLLSDGPYLSASSLSFWVISWAVGLFGLLLVVPFAAHARMGGRADDPDRRWELALSAWGGVALLALVAFGALVLAEGFSTGTALGAVALVGLLESALVFGALLLLVLTTG